MNKLRVIDLLNKIANGEEVPEKIKYDTKEMKYDHNKQDYLGYYSNGNGDWLFQYLFDRCRNTEHFINDEVEVIEEEPRDIEVCGSLFTRSEYNSLAGIKEDKTIQTIHDFQIGCGAVTEDRIEPYIKTLFHQQAILYLKINEIIDKINKGE